MINGPSGGGVNGGEGMEAVMGVEIGCHGEVGKVEEVGVGTGAPGLKLGGTAASGSINEKKL